MIDINFEELKEYLNGLNTELRQIFDDETLKYLLDIDTDIVRYGNIHSFMKKPLSTIFLYNSLKSILMFLIIIKEDREKIPKRYYEYLKEIIELWQI